MQANVKRKLAIGTTALAVAAFAGGAYAATQDPAAATRQAFLNDVAKRLNVSPAQLTAALRAAFDDQLQAAVAAGKLTQSQANAIKQRVQNGAMPPLGGLGFGYGGGPAPGRPPAGGGQLAAAAGYLGLTRQQLIDQLSGGKTLAQVAKARGKSVSGLESALSAAVRSRLQKAVSAKQITSAQEQQILSRLSQRIAQEVNGTGPGPGTRPPTFRGWHGPAGPPSRPGAFMPGAPPAPPPGPVY